MTIILIDFVFLIVIFYKLLMYTSPLFISNFDQQINLTQFQAFPFWNPFQYNGIPNLSPFTNLLTFVSTYLFMAIPSVLFGMSFGAKFFVMVTILLLTLAFNLIVSTFVKSLLAKLLSSLFFISNPFTLMLYVNGDFGLFPFEALLIIGLLFLKISVSKSSFINMYTMLASVCLSFSIAFFQAFYLGYPLYIIFALIFVYDQYKRKYTNSVILLRYFKTILTVSLLTALFLSPFILTIIYGNYNLSPNSTYALSSQTFNAYSVNPLSILFLKSYPPNIAWTSVETKFGTIVFIVWQTAEVLVIFLVLASFVVFRKILLLIFGILDIIISFFGSGPNGPFSIVTDFLYLHFYGYQAINASYYWNWIYLTVFLSISIAIIIDSWSALNFQRAAEAIRKRNHLSQIRKYLGFIFIALVIFVLITPIASQGYYTSSGGISEHSIPKDFTAIDGELKSLIGSNNTGVAFFNPDGYFFFNNNSNHPVINPIIDTPIVRTAGIPGYLTPSLSSNDYFYWLYHLFYTNETHYLGQLMALMAIQYFVVVYNSNPADFYPYYMPWSIGVNASHIMKYQVGVSLVISAKDYAIYKNDNNVSSAVSANNFTIVDGNYDSLNYMAYSGFNLTKLAILFGSDINYGNIDLLLNNTNQIITMNSNLDNLIFDASNNTVEINPINYLSNTNSYYNSGWINSYRILTSSNSIFSSQLSQYAVTQGNHNLSFKMTLPYTTTYYVAFKSLYQFDQGGSMLIKIGDYSIPVDDNFSQNFVTNSFAWNSFIVKLHAGVNQVVVQSITGLNSIGKIFLIPYSNYNTSLEKLNYLLNEKSIKIFEINGGSQLASIKGAGISYMDVNSGIIPNGIYIKINSLNSSNSFNLKSNWLEGNIAFLLKVFGSTNISLSYSIADENHCLFLHKFNTSNSWIWVILPLTNISGTNINLTFQGGVAYVSEFMFLSKYNNSLGNFQEVAGYDLSSYLDYSSNLGSNLITVNTFLGYKVIGEFNTFVLIRVEYYGVMIPNLGYATPIFGDLNTLLITNGTHNQIDVEITTFKIFSIGAAISIISAISYGLLVWLEIPNRIKGIINKK